MRLRMRTVALLTAALAFSAFSACGELTKTTDDPGAAAKADCPDCDPAGPNAFIQAGVADSFYTASSTWQVAYRFNETPLTNKTPDIFLPEEETQSEAFLFEYRVVGLKKDVFNNVLRDVVTIEVTQGAATGTYGDLFDPSRVDGFEKKVVFEMNDLLDPIRETVFTSDYPNGKTVELDSASSLTTGGSTYPRTIPRLLAAGGIDAPAPSLPVDLMDIADAMNPTWAEQSYKKYVFDNGDQVYWTKGNGDLWPFYVRTQRGEGVLVRFN
jgi:hypothetical protein